MLETRQGRGRPRRGRVTAMVLVGVALLAGCADASDDAAGSAAEEPLGVVPPDGSGDGDGPDAADAPDGADDDAEAADPDAVPQDDADADGPAQDDGGSAAEDGGGPDLAGLEAAAIELFEATEEVCADHAEAVGNTPIDPEHFTGAEVVEVRPGDPDLVVIQDGVGVELFVAVARDEVWGGSDPDAVMPRPYSFGCPPEVYVGTLDH